MPQVTYIWNLDMADYMAELGIKRLCSKAMAVCSKGVFN